MLPFAFTTVVSQRVMAQCSRCQNFLVTYSQVTIHLTFAVMAFDICSMQLPNQDIYFMHNTINFWYGNWEKVCMKRSWQREDAKKGGPALHTNKNFISNWFINWAIPEKRWELSTYIFEKNNWNFQVCYFTLGNSGQNKAIHP